MTRRAHRRLEELESEALGRTKAPAQFRESVEQSLELCNDYEDYLKKQLSGTMDEVTAQQKMIDDITLHIAYRQQMINECSTDWERVVSSSHIQQLQTYLESAMDARSQLSDEKVENECHLMEQLFTTRKMKDQFANILKKHEGHASRVIANAMSAHGVDENVYHSRSIDGNHCMKFGENGTKIVAQVTGEMRKVIKDENNIKYLEKLDASLNGILEIWYRLMRVMKSAKRQKPATIVKFKADTIALNKALHLFVSDEPVPGTGNAHPQFLKSHLLFDYHIQDFLELWETLGGFDEQSIESTHPQFNQLLRRYGNTRGQKLKRQVIRQFLFERASFVVELIDGMVKATSKPKRKGVKKRGSGDGEFTLAREETEASISALSQLEKDMNRNQILHPGSLENFPFVDPLDTCITPCSHCGKRLLKFGEAVHYHEYHSGVNTNDADEAEEAVL